MSSPGADLPVAAVATGSGPTLADRWVALRNRCVASPVFQKWAATLPFSRGRSRRHARELFDLCAGFVYSQVLFACVQLRLFDLLAEGARSSADVAGQLDLGPDAAKRLLEAATSLDLLERDARGQYRLGLLGAALRGNPAVVAMIRHHAVLYRDLADPVALLRGTAPPTGLSSLWGYSNSDHPQHLADADVAAYSALMSHSQPLVADEILDAYPLRLHDTVMDVGGGEGTFVLRAAARAPATRFIVFDLPAVARRAEQLLASAGLADRAQVVGGSFLGDPLPTGADLVTLIRVLHDHDDDAALALLRNVRAAVRRGGALLIAEPLKGTAGAEPVGGAYFEFYFLAMGQGHARSIAEIGALLDAAGFAAPEVLPTRQPLQVRLLVARPR